MVTDGHRRFMVRYKEAIFFPLSAHTLSTREPRFKLSTRLTLPCVASIPKKELFRILTALELAREQMLDELLRRIFISTQFTCSHNAEKPPVTHLWVTHASSEERGGVW